MTAARAPQARRPANEPKRATRRAAPRRAAPAATSAPARTVAPARKAAPTRKAAPRRAAPAGASAPTTARPRVQVHPRRFVSVRAIMTLSVVTFFVVLLVSVMIQSLRIEGQNHLDRTAASIAAENSRSLDLRAAVAERESPERIMKKARDLGMIDPGPVAPLSSEASTIESTADDVEVHNESPITESADARP